MRGVLLISQVWSIMASRNLQKMPFPIPLHSCIYHHNLAYLIKSIASPHWMPLKLLILPKRGRPYFLYVPTQAFDFSVVLGAVK